MVAEWVNERHLMVEIALMNQRREEWGLAAWEKMVLTAFSVPFSPFSSA